MYSVCPTLRLRRKNTSCWDNKTNRPNPKEAKTTYLRRTRSSRAPRPLGPPHLCRWPSHVHLRCFHGPIGSRSSQSQQQATATSAPTSPPVTTSAGRTAAPPPHSGRGRISRLWPPRPPHHDHHPDTHRHARLYAHPSPPHEGKKKVAIVSFHPDSRTPDRSQRKKLA